MIYAKGHSLWHVVRYVGPRITTLCGRQLPGDSRLMRPPSSIAWVFVCATCAVAIRRSFDARTADPD